MPRAELPPDEPERLAELEALRILDTSPDERFESLVRAAAHFFRVPTALVSLIDSNRQWFKATVGLGVSETPREMAFCAYAILAPGEVLVVEDATKDPRFFDNELVIGPPHIRFYAGAPIVSAASGRALGTLCIIDQQPRSLDHADRRSLSALAAVVSSLLELHRHTLFKAEEQQHTMKAELQRTEERQAAYEAMKNARDAAETADRAKSEFLAMMSHELRTPLNAVLGFSQIMKSEAFGPLGNDRYRTYVQHIYSSGNQLLRIINDILDLSRAASGKLDLNLTSIDARNAMEVACGMMQSSVSKANLSLTLNIPPGELVAFADERSLTQMLLNLLSNACKFTLPGGHIECSVFADATEIRFVITDTGIGIPPEHLDRVMLPFVQVDSSVARQHQGTGLGLAIVKIMAELNGGRISLKSVPKIGTTATLTLPREPAHSSSAETRLACAV